MKKKRLWSLKLEREQAWEQAWEEHEARERARWREGIAMRWEDCFHNKLLEAIYVFWIFCFFELALHMPTISHYML